MSIGRAPLPGKVEIIMNLGCLTKGSSARQSQKQRFRERHLCELLDVNWVLKRKTFPTKVVPVMSLPANLITRMLSSYIVAKPPDLRILPVLKTADPCVRHCCQPRGPCFGFDSGAWHRSNSSQIHNNCHAGAVVAMSDIRQNFASKSNGGRRCYNYSRGRCK